MSNELVETRSCETQLLLVQPGQVNRTQLAQLKSLSLQGTPVAGRLLLDSSERSLIPRLVSCAAAMASMVCSMSAEAVEWERLLAGRSGHPTI